MFTLTPPQLGGEMIDSRANKPKRTPAAQFPLHHVIDKWMNYFDENATTHNQMPSFAINRIKAV